MPAFRKCLFFALTGLNAFIQVGCLSVTTLQTGRTLGQGNKELSAAATFGTFPVNSLDLNDGFYEIPVFTSGTTYGLSEKLDMSVKLNSATYLSAGLKFQFLGTRESRFAASKAGEAGLLPLPLLGGDLGYYLSVPLIASYHPHELIALYIAPRYIFNRYEAGADNSSEMFVRNHIGGFTYGVSIGNKHKGIVEIAHFNQTLLSPTQFSVGYFYRIGF